MSDSPERAAWWEHVEPGRIVPVGVVLVDCELPIVDLDDATARLRTQYIAGTEYIGRQLHAAQPFEWHDHRLELIFGGDVEALGSHTFTAAGYLWQRLFVDLDVPARIVMHVGQVTRHNEPGAFSGSVLSEARSLLHRAPLRAVTSSSAAALLLTPKERAQLAVARLPAPDRSEVFVFPRDAATLAKAESRAAARRLELWDALVAYSNSPEVRRMRYVGLRLQRREPPSLDVSEVFIEPYVTVRERTDDTERSGSESGPPITGRRKARHESTVQPLRELLRTVRQVVLVGDPGAGKSTLLRWLAALVVDGRFPAVVQRMEPLLPLPISVGRLAEFLRDHEVEKSAKVLAAYYADRKVASASALSAFLDDGLKRGQCLVLFDGLDEVQPDERVYVQKWLEGFVAQFPANRIILTSRIVGYSGLRLPEGAALAEVRPFGDEQIARYVRAFHRAYLTWEHGSPSSMEAEAQTASLLDALRAHPRLGSLAANPFMLSALALVHRAEGRLPRHRVQAYQLLARTLCETWESARRLVLQDSGPVPVAYEEEAVPILGDLALAMHERYAAGVAPEPFVLSTLAGSLVRRRGLKRQDARHVATSFLRRCAEEAPLLAERGAGHWGFLHLTFQEFFVAVGLHADERFEDEVLKHALEPRWEEILRLGVSHMALVQNRTLAASRLIMRLAEWEAPPGMSWVSEVLQKQVALAASLAAELGNALALEDRSKLVERFARFIARATAYERTRYSALSLMSEKELIVNYVSHIADTDLAEALARVLVDELGRRGSSGADVLLSAIGHLRVPSATEALVTHLVDVPARSDHFYSGTGALADAMTFATLQQLAERPEPRVRALALAALAYLREPESVPVFAEALDADDTAVRERAMSGLLELSLYANVYQSVSLAQLLARLDDPSEEVRAIALRLLDHGEYEATSTEEALLRVMRMDPSQRIRADAAFTALRLFSTDRIVDAAMETLASTDEDEVRWGLVQAFGVREDARDAQRKRISNGLRSPNELLRAGCVLAQWMFPSDAAEQAARRALDDASPVVRREAIRALTRLRSKDAVTIAIAHLRDAHATVREESAMTLCYQWNPTAEQPLIEATADSSAAVRRWTLHGLRSARSKHALDTVIGTLSDPAPAVRKEAVEALSRRKEERAARGLLRALADKSEEVRAEAATALGGRRPATGLSGLITLLRDKREKVRWAAASAIAQIDDPKAIPALVRLARHEPAARAALWHMMDRRGWRLRPAPARPRRKTSTRRATTRRSPGGRR